MDSAENTTEGATVEAPATGEQEFIVQGTLRMDEQVYRHGAAIRLSDAELIAELRAAHAIALPAETLAPAELQSALDAKDGEIASLQARLAELERLASAAGQSGDATKSGN